MQGSDYIQNDNSQMSLSTVFRALCSDKFDIYMTLTLNLPAVLLSTLDFLYIALIFLQKYCLRYKQNIHPAKMYVLPKNVS